MAASLQKTSPARIFAALVVLICFASLVSLSGTASGAHLTNRKITLANDSVNANTTYTLGFGIASAGVLGSIQAQFCANDPLIGDPCDQPAGLDVSGATLSAESGETGFSVSGASTANNLILTRIPSPASIQPVSYTLDGVINPSAGGSYYLRLQTFASNDATGSSTDYGGAAFSITDGLKISAQVPPYILFCAAITIPPYNCGSATGKIVAMGNLTTNKTSTGQSQLLVATNAGNGYTVYVQGTTLTSGNSIIDNLTAPSFASIGTNQFGFNLRSNLTPAFGADPTGPGNGVPTAGYNQPDSFKFVSGDVIAGSPFAEDYRRYTVSYIADINSNQLPGIYVSTLTYVCVGNF